MKNISVLFSIVLLILTAFTMPVMAETTSLFILDSSGSMWGRLPDKQSKIAVAKSVLSEVVGNLPSSVAAGLIAYGHRRKGDCSDIEMVHKIEVSGGKQIAAKLGKLSPRGKTPISDALQMAGEALTGIEDNTTIVLVSDGIETCKGDPCAVAAALAQSYSKLKIHVVGYAVNGGAAKQLQCIAEKGRGAYFTADDSDGLSIALNKVSESIKTEQPIEMAPPVEPAVQEIDSTSLKIMGPGTIRLKLSPWAKMPKYWKVLDPETGEEIAKTSKSEMSVMPGQYQVSWRHLEHGSHEVTLPHVIDVKSGEVTVSEINTGIHIIAPKGLERPYYWQLLAHHSDLRKPFRSRKPVAWYSVYEPVPVPAGTYTLMLRQGEHGFSELNMGAITLHKGELLKLPLDQGINLGWNKEWGNEIHYLQLTDTNGVKVRLKNKGLNILPTGNYKMAFRLKQHGWRDASFGELVVKETGFTDPQLTSGITFETKIKGEFKLFALNLETNEETRMDSKWGPMPLGAGRYRIDLKMKKGKRKTLVPEVTIKANQFIKAKM